MANAVGKCVHCGFCLPACPTYNVLNEEMDSPRGRIILMKSVLEGNIDLEEALPYIDRCLGCLGCVTACPSGVPYGELVTPFRAFAENKRKRRPTARLARRLTRETLPYPDRFRLAAFAGKFAKPAAGILPSQFQAMLSLLPGELPAADPLPDINPVQGKRRARVALLTGCVQQALAPEINRATLRVLVRNGVEVVIPKEQVCCGGLALHTGDQTTARLFAITNLRTFPADVDAVITTAAGCGSSLHEYLLLLRDTEWVEAAETFSGKALDISVFLDQLGIEAPPELPYPVKIAYHDACHLVHAQKVTSPPRNILNQIPGITILSIPESELCCGSAGSYSLEHPEIASELGNRKARHILSTGAQIVATGNIGCLVQLRTHLNQIITTNGDGIKNLPVMHTIEVLDQAYAGWF